MATREELTDQSNNLQLQIAANKSQFDAKLAELKKLQSVGEDTGQVEVELDNIRQNNAELNNSLNLNDQAISNLNQAEDPTSTIKSPNAVNPDNNAENTQQKYQNAGTVGATGIDEFGDLEGAMRQQQNTSGMSVVDETGAVNPNLLRNPETGELYSRGDQLAAKGIAPGAEKVSVSPARVRTLSPSGKELGNDLRAKIRVPNEYFAAEILSPGLAQLKKFNGIIFPYTPAIRFEHQANYASQQPMHSNFALNFYQRSSVGNINIQAKFTVQNKQDAEIYIGTMQLLSAITKMKFGNDMNAGTPPPVCRLDAFGTYMLRNVPISITNFTVEFPDSVDYFVYSGSDPEDITSVPTLSSVYITCVLMYSRREMQEFTIDNFVSTYAWQKRKGFL